MFTLTLTTRDYVPFTISGEAVSIITACMVMQSGLQVRQPVTIKLADDRGNDASATLGRTKPLVAVVEAFAGLLTQ